MLEAAVTSASLPRSSAAPSSVVSAVARPVERLCRPATRARRKRSAAEAPCRNGSARFRNSVRSPTEATAREAARASRSDEPQDHGRRDHRVRGDDRVQDRHDRQGRTRGPRSRHGRDRTCRHCRPDRRAERERREGAAAHRSQRRRRCRSSSGGSRARRVSSWARATTSCAWNTCRRSPTSTVGDVVVTSGIDGIYPKGFVIGRVESWRRAARHTAGSS